MPQVFVLIYSLPAYIELKTCNSSLTKPMIFLSSLIHTEPVVVKNVLRSVDLPTPERARRSITLSLYFILDE